MPPFQPFETARLRLRNWREEDRDLFHEINADRKVMEFFPFRRTRTESDILFDRVKAMISGSGLGFYAVTLKDTDEAIGFCGLAKPGLAPILPEDSVEIGWRLATRFWGNGYMTEAAKALLRYGFEDLRLPEIISFAVATNIRSTAVMQRIGLRHDPARDFDHPRVPETHPHLTRHVFYALTVNEWQRRRM